MEIKQILLKEDYIYGLGEDNKMYRWLSPTGSTNGQWMPYLHELSEEEKAEYFSE
ncbi:hypothetical protein K2Q08_00580 [Patescibacteria group bacterium]|nr:hypothetical protein [Patescibacteria group bacterium]